MRCKRIFKLIFATMIIVALVVSCVACIENAPSDSDVDINSMDAKCMAKELLTSDNFTLEQDGDVILKCNGLTLYLKIKGEILGDYDEYYFMPDEISSGKYWVCHRSYFEDTWTKMALVPLQQILYLNDIKENSIWKFLMQYVFTDFDEIMQEENNAYMMKKNYCKVFLLDSYKLSKEDGKLIISIAMRDEFENELTVSDFNKTVITIPRAVMTAEVGYVDLDSIVD